MAPKSPKPKKPSKTQQQSSANVVMPDIDPNTSFTAENFEKELEALAAKAKDETWAKHMTEQAPPLLKSAMLLTLIAVYSNVSELALSPVYGSIPSSIWHSKLVMAACFVGWSSNLWMARGLPIKPHFLLPIVAIYIPMVQFYLFKLSGVFTASWGPLITEAFTLFPLIVISVACTANHLDGVDLGFLPGFVRDAAPGLGSYGFFRVVEGISAGVIQSYVGKTFFFTRIGLQAVLAACYSLFAPSKLLLYTIPALMHTSFLNSHAQTSLGTASLNSTLNAQGWVLLDRRESLTGYISVVESLTQGYRVLRCDHSLLGGEWVKFKDGQFAGNKVAEPIYGVFAMLEAVRLVQVPNPVPDRKAKAFVIGMGIGTTPAALVAHGIDTTVVEIDPVVQEFALKYFRLPSNHKSVIADAVGYAATLANSSKERFDYIVHDVFTGGAEPIELFTLEFLQSLNALLTPNGVIAINYAGDFTLPPPAVIVQTIREVFPSCRIFREHPRDEEAIERDGSDFTNMVIFCTKLATGISFREPTAGDILNSPSREAFLMPKHEVADKDFLVGQDQGILRRNDTGKLVKWHEKSALGHWTVMRQVVPKEVWENW